MIGEIMRSHDSPENKIEKMVNGFYDSLLVSINESKIDRMKLSSFKYIRNKSWWSDETEFLVNEKEALVKANVNFLRHRFGSFH
jgi:hypothetical protein